MWAEISRAAFISIPVVGMLFGLFCMRTAYATYKLLGDRRDGVTFSWFYTALQSPWYASQVWGQADLAEALPDELKASVAGARRQINYGIAAIISWTVFALSFGALAAHLHSRI